MVGYKCNLVIPGFGKSGTSSLHEYLNLHPDICMSKPKETHFFALDEKYKKGEQFHNKIFDWAGEKTYKYYGESSTIHCIWEPALRRIQNDLTTPKIILLLRHPVDRLISHYNWLWALNLEKRPLINAVIEEQKKDFNPKISLNGNYPCYLLSSNYSYWCQLITKIFGKENVLFLDSEQMFKNKENALNLCFKYLELSQLHIKRTIHKNKTEEQGIQRPLGLSYLAKMAPKKIKETVNPDGKISKLLYSALGKKRIKNKPEISDEDLSKIRNLLSKDVEFYNKIFEK